MSLSRKIQKPKPVTIRFGAGPACSTSSSPSMMRVARAVPSRYGHHRPPAALTIRAVR